MAAHCVFSTIAAGLVLFLQQVSSAVEPGDPLIGSTPHQALTPMYSTGRFFDSQPTATLEIVNCPGACVRVDGQAVHAAAAGSCLYPVALRNWPVVVDVEIIGPPPIGGFVRKTIALVPNVTRRVDFMVGGVTFDPRSHVEPQQAAEPPVELPPPAPADAVPQDPVPPDPVPPDSVPHVRGNLQVESPDCMVCTKLQALITRYTTQLKNAGRQVKKGTSELEMWRGRFANARVRHQVAEDLKTAADEYQEAVDAVTAARQRATEASRVMKGLQRALADVAGELERARREQATQDVINRLAIAEQVLQERSQVASSVELGVEDKLEAAEHKRDELARRIVELGERLGQKGLTAAALPTVVEQQVRAMARAEEEVERAEQAFEEAIEEQERMACLLDAAKVIQAKLVGCCPEAPRPDTP